MLLEKEHSCLLLIDVQEKLTPLIAQPESLIKNCQWLLRLANDLKITKIVSEQYPQGLGKTIEPLQPLIVNDKNFIKTEFSCFRAQGFKANLEQTNKKQIVLIGIETHVCILQTAFDLVDAGFRVFVVVNAVGSRSPLDYKYALKRMRDKGVYLITTEMVFFEWIGQAGTEEFKTLNKIYLK